MKESTYLQEVEDAVHLLLRAGGSLEVVQVQHHHLLPREHAEHVQQLQIGQSR
jgi:hypothetical protein